MNITIVKRGSWRSYHTSFKKACLCYGWDYEEAIKGGTPIKWRGYSIEKVQTEYSIPTMKLERAVEKFELNVWWNEDYELSNPSFEANVDEWIIEGNFGLESFLSTTSTDRGDLVEREYVFSDVDIERIFNPEGDDVSDQINKELYWIIANEINDKLC